MKTFFVSITFLFASIFLFVGGSSAETICLRSRLVKGKIVNTSRAVADGQKCPRKFKPLFSSTSLTTVGSNVVGAPGPQGPKGDAGAQGPQGVAGVPGNSGSSEILAITSSPTVPDSTSPKYISVTCPSGYSLIGGYGSVDNNSFSPVDGVAIGFQSGILNTFAVKAFEAIPTASNWVVKAYAYCRPS